MLYSWTEYFIIFNTGIGNFYDYYYEWYVLLFIVIIWSQIFTRSGRSRARVHTGVFGAQRYCSTVLRPHLSPSPDKSRRMGPQWLEVRKKTDRPFRRNGIRAPKGKWGTSNDVRRWRTSVRPIRPGTRRYGFAFLYLFLGQTNYIKNLIGFGISHIVGWWSNRSTVDHDMLRAVDFNSDLFWNNGGFSDDCSRSDSYRISDLHYSCGQEMERRCIFS